MDYTKRPLTLQEQVDKLRDLGLLIDDELFVLNLLNSTPLVHLVAHIHIDY